MLNNCRKVFDLVSTYLKFFVLKVGFVNIKFSGIVYFGRRPRLYCDSKSSIHLDNIVARDYVKLLAVDGGEIILSRGVFLNDFCSFNAIERIEVGEDTIFGESVRIYDHDHAFDEGGVSKKRLVGNGIAIGKNCWVGSNVVITRGVSICDNVVIGAGLVVTKSITEPGVYVQGSHSVRKLKKEGWDCV